MGDVTPKEESFEPTTMLNDKMKSVSVVRMILSMNHPVEDAIYSYITSEID